MWRAARTTPGNDELGAYAVGIYCEYNACIHVNRCTSAMGHCPAQKVMNGSIIKGETKKHPGVLFLLFGRIVFTVPGVYKWLFNKKMISCQVEIV